MEVQAIASSRPPAAATAIEDTAAVASPVVASAKVSKVQDEPSLAQLTDAVSKINKSMASESRGLEFSVDSDSKRTVVKVVDRQTNELIRQIPTVETLQIAHALDQAQGLLIKQQA
jgi:flagellar protein FlaG